MRVIFAGTPSTAASALRGLSAASIDIALVITRPDAPTGRKQVLTESPVAVTARELGLKVLKTSALTSEENDLVAQVNADIGVVVAYGSFLSEETLGLLPKGWVNLHFSLLPKYRGAAPVQHALMNGEKETGISVFQIDSSMDGGEIYLQVPTVIEPLETAGRLLERLTSLGVSALVQVLPQIVSGILQGKAQDDSEKTFASKISRLQARINWSKSGKEIESLICAMNPEPMAWTDFNGTSLRIISAVQAESENQEIAVTGRVTVADGAVFVECGAGSRLKILEVQPAGKNVMSAMDWIHGFKAPHGLGFE
ncbi:MAG: methionyl-tRNA formyltransferase [Actinobacteria bacterium]|uniref:methionyl-tRNA formyltransferase n=1 Tax=freshwater metagenome TaxID=449393 RepID=A0A6J6D7Y0_9ZZZZ|nr:methionyl-tRNA formyltransferase [Actinomycetota bacterium]